MRPVESYMWMALGHRISLCHVNHHKIQFLFQHFGLIMQRSNAALFGENFFAASEEPDM